LQSRLAGTKACRGICFFLYNASMPETKPFRLTESVKAAG
jgi:hypothetical protein